MEVLETRTASKTKLNPPSAICWPIRTCRPLSKVMSEDWREKRERR